MHTFLLPMQLLFIDYYCAIVCLNLCNLLSRCGNLYIDKIVVTKKDGKKELRGNQMLGNGIAVLPVFS